MTITPQIKLAASVDFRLRIRDTDTGKIVRKLPRQKNLILNQGLDGLKDRKFGQCFSSLALGDGTDPVKRDSGAVTLTRAADTVTASAGFFEAQDVGRLLKFDSGEEMTVTAFTSATEVTVSETGALAASEGTVYYVNRTGLANEIKRTSTYSTAAGDCGMSFTYPTKTFKRTFIASAESGPVTYREIGWSHTGSAGTNLFGMALLAGAGVSLVAGQQLEAVVELSVTISPAASEAWVNPIAGFGGDGVHGFEMADFSKVESSGNTEGSTGSLEPTGEKTLKMSTGTTAIQALTHETGANPGGTTLPTGLTLTPDAYVDGSFTRTYRGTLSVSQNNSASIRSIYLARVTGGGGESAYRVLLDAAATKASDHTLEFVFSLSWGRALVN